ncbi:MAG: AMP-binding protein [Desulfobacteraceae bacterium]|jgi:phenylacetate-CoA ligase
MNLHTYFTKHIYWPLTQKIKGEYASRALEELSESQWKSKDKLLSNQWQHVIQTVNKAVREVPYYRQSYTDIGWEANKKAFSYEDFLNFPKVEKESLRDNITEFLNPNYRGRVTNGRTSGSTGQSLTLYYDRENESYSEAGRWRAKDWWGVSPGSRQVSIWGRPFTGYKDRLSQKVKSYFMNTLLFSAFDLNKETLENIWKKISRFKPTIIYGYPSAIFPLSVYLKENKIQANNLGLKVIMTTAETITPQQRSLIENVFGCKTANEYGCSETGGFVYECPHGSWHVSSELTFIEVLDREGNPQPPGQSGEIVITHLRNNYMPLIRYRVGDIGALLSGVCDCGRGLPLMEVSVTKESDIFRLADGRTYSSEIFDYINLAVMKVHPDSILQFKVVQKTIDSFRVEIVAGSNTVDHGERLFKRLMKEQLGEKIKVQIKRVPCIEREPSGKLKYFISDANKVSEIPAMIHIPCSE